MLYFKHSELTKKYQISLKTVHNWIDAAKKGKVDLHLHNYNNRTYIINSPSNISLLERLVKQGRKYRNTIHHKTIEPTKKFYELYSPKEIYDIVANLKTHHEIPRQYNYIDEGAINWDKFAKRLWKEKNDNILKSTIKAFKANFDAIDSLLENHSKINIVDLGPGNALPIRGLLDHLLNKGILNRYIAIDISQSMLNIAENNIKKWFGSKVRFEGHIKDISHQRFDDLLVEDMISENAKDTLNLVLLLGATPMNFRQPYDVLRPIFNSLGEKDLLIYTDKPDSIEDRNYFNFHPEQGIIDKLSPNHRFMFDLLNIDESLYKTEMGFNQSKRVRFIQVKLKTALTIKFNIGKNKINLKFNKGDPILLWRAWHQTTLEIISRFERSGFTLLHSSLSKDRQYLMTISGISHNNKMDY